MRCHCNSNVVHVECQKYYESNRKDQEIMKGTIIDIDGSNWCIKWNNHLWTVVSYDIWKNREHRAIMEEKDNNGADTLVEETGVEKENENANTPPNSSFQMKMWLVKIR